MKTYLIQLTIVVDRATYEPHLPSHLAYLGELHERGQLLLSGPFADRTGGMVMIQARTWEEAEAIAQNDPLVRNGVDRYELREWVITNGTPTNIPLHRPDDDC